jgi:hypothetical protein
MQEGRVYRKGSGVNINQADLDAVITRITEGTNRQDGGCASIETVIPCDPGKAGASQGSRVPEGTMITI